MPPHTAILAEPTEPQNSPSTLVFFLILGLAIALWQLALVTNFRGYRDSHARRIGKLTSKTTGKQAGPGYTKAVQLVVGSILALAGLVLATFAAVSLIHLANA